MGRARDRREEN